MTDRSADIAALLKKSENMLARIQDEYQESLEKQEIAHDLRIDIKNLCENLRSVLDYVAHDIRERYCPNAKPDARFYFPILPDSSTFRSCMSKWFPGLENGRPGLWAYLESVQPYHPEFAWLGQFNELNNENKHGRLVEQTRSEIQRVDVTTPGGGSVNWNPANVRFGSRIYIGGVPVNPLTQMPVPDPSIAVSRIFWVDFRFAGLDVSALHLLKQAVGGVRAISGGVEMLM